MTERASALKRYGLSPLFNNQEFVSELPSPISIWVSEELDAADADRAWNSAVRDSQLADLSIFMATQESGIFDAGWEELSERCASFDRALKLSEPNPLTCPDWAEPAVERSFSDAGLRSLLKRFGVKIEGSDHVNHDDMDEHLLPLLEVLESRGASESRGSSESRPAESTGQLRTSTGSGAPPQNLSWPVRGDERVSRIVACEGHPVTGPLRLGWMWDVKTAVQVAHLWQRWNSSVGFMPAKIGMATLDAYSSVFPQEIQVTRNLVLDQLAFCPDLGQDDDPVVSALVNVFSHQWAFWWD